MSSPAPRLGFLLSRFKSDSPEQSTESESPRESEQSIKSEAPHESEQSIKSEAPHESKPNILDTPPPPEPTDLDSDSPSTNKHDLKIPIFDSDNETEEATFTLDPILQHRSPIFGSLLATKYNALSTPLSDSDDLLRLAARQSAQEIADAVNSLGAGRITRREVQGKIREALERVAGSRGVGVKILVREFESARREGDGFAPAGK